jgi:hypothetical protein
MIYEVTFTFHAQHRILQIFVKKNFLTYTKKTFDIAFS